MSDQNGDLTDLLGGIIDTAIALTEADFGHIQLVDAEGRLRIVAKRGFPDGWRDDWNVAASEHCVCGRALALKDRVIVEDVESSPLFFSNPSLETLRDVGVRAVQSTPLLTPSGDAIGLLSTHCGRTCRLDAGSLKVLDLLAAHASTLIERTWLEAELRLSEERFRLAMDATEEGIWDWNLDTGAVYMSPAYAMMLGYDRDELVPHVSTWASLLDPDEADIVSARVHRLMTDEGHWSIEFRMRHKDGRYVWILERGKVVARDAEGRPRRAIGTHKDISEHRAWQEKAHLSEQRLAEAQKLAHMGSFEYNLADGSTIWSKEAYRIYRLDPAAPPPTPDEMLARGLLPEDGNELRESFLAKVKLHQPFDLDCRFVLPSGELRWVHFQAVPHFDDQGQVLRYVGNLLDITERKHREEEFLLHAEVIQSLTRQQVAMQTAAAFAHELNQPLLATTAYNEVALRTLDGNPTQLDQLPHVIKAGRDQALRAGEVLNALNAQLHRSVPDPVPFDLNALVREVMASKKLWLHRFRPNLELQPGLPLVLGHRLQTEKVLANLIQNGLEVMEEARLPSNAFVVSVATRSDGSMAQVTVRDNGPGLHADAVAAIFKPFFTTKPHGLGLGLSICRALIEVQQGRLWFDAGNHPGAVFHFTLPFAHD